MRIKHTVRAGKDLAEPRSVSEAGYGPGRRAHSEKRVTDRR